MCFFFVFFFAEGSVCLQLFSGALQILCQDWLHFMLFACSGQVNSTMRTAHACSDTFITLISGDKIPSHRAVSAARPCVSIQVWGNKDEDPNAHT